MTDPKTMLDDNWNAVTVLKPFIGLDPPKKIKDYGRAIVFKPVEDIAHERDLKRTMYDEDSIDNFECEIVDKNKTVIKPIIDEVRRVFRLKDVGETIYPYVDWSGGEYTLKIEGRWKFKMFVHCYKTGIDVS